MKLQSLVLVALATLTSIVSAKIESVNVKGNPTRAEAIKKAFVESYSEYTKYCDGQDALRPLSKTCDNSLGGFGATLIDAISTAHFMGLDDLVAESIAKVEKIDYTVSPQDPISLFETNIRHLGGLISAYELTGKKYQKLIDQAVIVGDKLLKGWVDNNDLPYNQLHWNGTQGPNVNSSAIIAETGTLILEFAKLSHYSGDSTYFEHALKANQVVIQSFPVFPGLYSQVIDPRGNRPGDDYVTTGGGSDSFFEYLIKYDILFNKNTNFSSTWETGIASAVKYLITTADGFDNLTYLTDYSARNGGNIQVGSHLACYLPGNWIYGGTVLGSPKVVEYGLKLAESCYNTYAKTATGIGPEVWTFVGAGNITNGVEVKDRDYFEKNGFYPSVPAYILRPEVEESMFYAYRITGDPIWQERSWEAFKAIRKYCRAKKGALDAFVGIRDVTNTSTAQYDSSESFFYAETLKYLYLTQTDNTVGSLDEFVYNTEGHPLLRHNGGPSDARLKATCSDLASCLEGKATRPSKVTPLDPSKTADRIPFSSNFPGMPQSFEDAPQDFGQIVANSFNFVVDLLLPFKREDVGEAHLAKERMNRRKVQKAAHLSA